MRCKIVSATDFLKAASEAMILKLVQNTNNSLIWKGSHSREPLPSCFPFLSRRIVFKRETFPPIMLQVEHIHVPSATRLQHGDRPTSTSLPNVRATFKGPDGCSGPSDVSSNTIQRRCVDPDSRGDCRLSSFLLLDAPSVHCFANAHPFQSR